MDFCPQFSKRALSTSCVKDRMLKGLVGEGIKCGCGRGDNRNCLSLV